MQLTRVMATVGNYLMWVLRLVVTIEIGAVWVTRLVLATIEIGAVRVTRLVLVMVTGCLLLVAFALVAVELVWILVL